MTKDRITMTTIDVIMIPGMSIRLLLANIEVMEVEELMINRRWVVVVRLMVVRSYEWLGCIGMQDRNYSIGIFGFPCHLTPIGHIRVGSRNRQDESSLWGNPVLHIALIWHHTESESRGYIPKWWCWRRIRTWWWWGRSCGERVSALSSAGSAFKGQWLASVAEPRRWVRSACLLFLNSGIDQWWLHIIKCN